VLLRPRSGQRGGCRTAAVAVTAVAVAVAVAGCQVAAARPAVRPAPPPGTHSAAPVSVPVPVESSGRSPRIMIVGDSITQGSSGDYTWQYRLYEHLLADGVRPTMVGPYGWLFNNVASVQGDHSYADPHFEHANDATWGMALFREKNAIGGKVAKYRPDYLLVILGLNDLFWFGLSQSVMAQNLASFIAAARTARPHIRIVFGLVPPDIHEQKPSFAASVASYNNTIIATAARLSTTASPLAVAHDGAGINVAADLWDGTHPNANGEIRIAAAFADVLASRYHLGKTYPKPFPVLPTGPLTSPHLTVRPSKKAGQALLSWTLAPGAGSYFIYIEDVTRGETTFKRLPLPLPAAENPWTAGLLTSGDTYAFKVQGCKGVDCGAFSNPATVTAP